MFEFSRKTSKVSIAARRATRERFRKLVINLLALTAAICSAQACGQFNGAVEETNANLSTGEGSNPGSADGFDLGGPSGIAVSTGDSTAVYNPNGLVIVQSSATAHTGQAITYTYGGPALDANATIAWTHAMKVAADGSTAACTELNGTTNSVYQLTCPKVGALTVTMKAFDLNVLIGPINKVFAVTEAAVVVFNPNPTGAALYKTNCQSCHSVLATSTISLRSATGITTAIKQQRAMQSLSFLTPTEIQQISDAINGK